MRALFAAVTVAACFVTLTPRVLAQRDDFDDDFGRPATTPAPAPSAPSR